MRIGAFSETYSLTEKSIDIISEKIQKLLVDLKTERANIHRIRLSLEEVLLRWQFRFGKEAEVEFSVSSKLGNVYVVFTLEGEEYDPLENAPDELGNWSESLLKTIDTVPVFSFLHGKNTVTLCLKKPRANAALNLIICLITGVIIGIIGKFILSDAIQSSIIKTVLQPVNSMFFRALNAVAGPVLFFTVIVSIYNTGNVAAMGRDGKRMIRRFIIMSFIIVTVMCLLVVPFMGFKYSNEILDKRRFSSALDLLLHFVPNDVFMPFVRGESPQLLLIAILLGNAILFLGNSAAKLTPIIEQINNIGLTIASWVARIAPYLVSVILILEIWNGSVDVFIGIWRPLVLFLLCAVILMAVYLAYISIKHKIRISLLVRKLIPSFVISLKTASVHSALGDIIISCENKLGISKRMTKYSISTGLVLYMPAGSMAALAFTLYTAYNYGVETSVIWFVVAILLTVLLLIATPPVTGVGLLAYTAIFSQLGIPSAALEAAVIADVIFGFFVSAFNQAMLQAELVIQADKFGFLNEQILKKEEK